MWSLPRRQTRTRPRQGATGLAERIGLISSGAARRRYNARGTSASSSREAASRWRACRSTRPSAQTGGRTGPSPRRARALPARAPTTPFRVNGIPRTVYSALVRRCVPAFSVRIGAQTALCSFQSRRWHATEQYFATLQTPQRKVASLLQVDDEQTPSTRGAGPAAAPRRRRAAVDARLFRSRRRRRRRADSA